MLHEWPRVLTDAVVYRYGEEFVAKCENKFFWNRAGPATIQRPTPDLLRALLAAGVITREQLKTHAAEDARVKALFREHSDKSTIFRVISERGVDFIESAVKQALAGRKEG